MSTTKKATEDWYLLYGGQSEDGRGTPVYKSRTTDPKVAIKFHQEFIGKSQYAFGKVVRVTDKTMTNVTADDLKEEIKALNRKAGAQKRLVTLSKKKATAEAQGDWGAFA